MEKQTSEWNCGPTALSHLLALEGHIYSPSNLEEILTPTEELGTDPRAIEQFLQDVQIDYQLGAGSLNLVRKENLPTLVNMNYENDGDHYMVVTDIDIYGSMTMWDPYTAETRYYSYNDFINNWYSPLKGLRRWSLYLTKRAAL